MEQTQKINYKRPFVYPYQRNILDSPARFTVCEASTKVGKTASHIIWLFEQALQGKTGQNYWWIAPVFSQAEIAFKRMRLQVKTKGFFIANETKLTLTLPNGAVIHFKSADRADNLYGEDVYAAVFDEFTRAKQDAWIALRSTLTATKGKCRFIGNVKGKRNWGYQLAQKAKSEGLPTYEHFKITAWDAVDAGLLSREEIEQAQKDLPESAFNELYLAEATDDGSNVFGFKYIDACITELSEKEPICFGIDLARKSDYTVLIGLDEDCRVCYFDRFQHSWDYQIERIKFLPRNKRIRIDSTGVGDAICGILDKDFPLLDPFVFTQKSKQQIIEGLAVAIQKATIGFPDGIIVDELKDLETTFTRTGISYEAGSGHDDTVMALAMALSAWTNQKASGHGQYIFSWGEDF